jgi:hypothetical protein
MRNYSLKLRVDRNDPRTKISVRRLLQDILESSFNAFDRGEFHHGDCVGAAQINETAWMLGFNTVVHPPTNTRNRFFCKPRPYLNAEAPLEYVDFINKLVPQKFTILSTTKEIKILSIQQHV